MTHPLLCKQTLTQCKVYLTRCKGLFTWIVDGESTLVMALLGDFREEGALLSTREADDPAIRSDAEKETVRGGKADLNARIHSQPYEHVILSHRGIPALPLVEDHIRGPPTA